MTLRVTARVPRRAWLIPARLRDHMPPAVAGVTRWVAILIAAGIASPVVWGYPSERTPSDNEQARRYFAEARQHQHGQRWREAITAYKQSLKLDSSQAEAYNNLGFCHKSLGEFSRAVPYYKDALRLNPNLAEAYEYLGEAYLGMGKLDLARKQARRLKALNPGLAEALQAKIDEAASAAAPESAR